jgi:hypothetical protein
VSLARAGTAPGTASVGKWCDPGAASN